MADDQTSERQRVLYRVDGHVATITLNRPDKLNALTFAMRDQLIEYVERAGADEAVRVVILQGAGRAFTSGVDVADLPAVQDPLDRSEQEDASLIDDAARKWSTLLRTPKPIIVKARGYCAAWGLEIALHADFVITSHDCQFFFPSVRNGSGFPDSSMVVHHLGPQWAKRLLMVGDPIDGRTAAQIGLAMQSVDDGDLDDAVTALAAKLSARTASLLAAGKAIVNHAVDLRGRQQVQSFATAANAHARRDPLAGEFGRIMRERGHRAAVAWADGQLSIDD